MCMTVKAVPRSGDADQPVQGLQPMMRLVLVVMNSVGWRVADQDVECTAEAHAIQHQAGQELKGPQIGLGLRILVLAVRSVTNGPTKATDQEPFMADQLEVQVGATLRPGVRVPLVL